MLLLYIQNMKLKKYNLINITSLTFLTKKSIPLFMDIQQYDIISFIPNLILYNQQLIRLSIL